MNPNEIQPAVPVEHKGINTDEVRKVSFWVSQVFVLAATVAGVYLAANQGFRQAVAYEKLMGDKSNYYLRLSLRGELADNIELVKEYMEKLKTGGLPARKAPFQLDTFVWDSMKFSPATLETPSELLAASRRFYREVADIRQKVADNTYGVDNANKRLQALIDDMQQTVLPNFDRDIEGLRKTLTANGIPL